MQGAEKTVGAIIAVKDGLKSIASTSLETKAAIIGAIYALERLFTASGQRGTALENFSALTGMATKTVQQYQWAAQQVGVSNEEVTGSFINLQKNMTKTLLGKGAPEGLGMFARKGGNVTTEDIAEYQKHPELLLQKLQEYAKKEKNPGLRNEVMHSFGLGDNMIAAMDREAFTPEKLSKAPTYSDSQIQQLDKANAAWKNLGSSVEMMFGKLNAKHGVELVSDIQKLVGPLSKLLETFVTFAEKMKLFDAVKIIFEAMAKAIDLLAIGMAKLENSKFLNTFMKTMGDSFSALMKISAGGNAEKELGVVGKDLAPGVNAIKNTVKEQTTEKSMNPFLNMIGLGSGVKENNPKPPMNNATPEAPKTGAYLPSQAIAPNAPVVNNASNTQTIEVNQNMTFQRDDGSNHKQVGDAFKSGVKNAFRQIPALGQGT